MTALHIVFDAFPGPEGSRFIEIENDEGVSLSYGEWRARGDGSAELLIPDHRPLLARVLRRLEEIYSPEDEELYVLREEVRAAIEARGQA